MRRRGEEDVVLVDDPLWYKDAIIYELHVRAFCDSNGDGIGDFNGLVQKLDYLQDLGATAIWLLPFYPSPLRDDGYDIADYASINPSYGTLRDFKRFLREAHKRGLRVITELVINHTSDQHEWFQKARRAAPGSKWRDFYVWSDDPSRYRDARIIFQDFEHSNWTWDPVAGAYYWHRFYHHQPDLNFDNPRVRKAVLRALDFWMDMGVDGMRLDAVPYLYEREGTNCENLPETHAFLRELRTHLDRKYDNRMFLAEANQWPEDAAEYFGDGDECHMNFHFPVMPRMFMSVQLENNFPILDILEQTPELPDGCQWAVFLRNHDELTLEMVTDEDRDYMYRVYASDPQARINLGIRRRLAPLLKTRRQVELLNGMLFALPGTPVLYYGDEIGMGDNIYLGDRDGVRTPMQWSPDRNAGFSRANPQRLYLPVIIDPEYHYESINVEAQQANPSSLLWWMKRLIALRKEHQCFGRGSIHFLHPDNTKVLAFIRKYGDDHILCVFNLSRFAQYVELDLAEYEEWVPMELFGHTEFPRIGELTYLLTLGPHSFYWFYLRHPAYEGEEEEALPSFEVSRDWHKVLHGRSRRGLEKALPRYMRQRRWFRGKARKTKAATIADVVPVPSDGSGAQVCFVDVEYVDQATETYVLPLIYLEGEDADWMEEWRPDAVIAQLRIKGSEDEGLLCDAMSWMPWLETLLAQFGRKRSATGNGGSIRVKGTRAYRRLRSGATKEQLAPHLGSLEQTNTSVVYGDRFVLKLYRSLERGENPEIEMTRYLTQRAGFEHTPPLAGTLDYERKGQEPVSLGVLQGFVPNQGDAWKLTLEMLDGYFERVIPHLGEVSGPPVPRGSHVERAGQELPAVMREVIGVYEPLARLLGQRTAEMHLALAAASGDEALEPEEFSTLHQRSLYQSSRARARQTFQSLRRRIKSVPDDLRDSAREMLDRQGEVDALFKRVVGHKIEAVRVRTHGDYHLGQVLYTGKDFVIIDFEGEPARPIGERRFKRSPLRDVAGMLRSFHYAAVSGLHGDHIRQEDRELLAPWAEAWHDWVVAAYLDAWLKTAGDAPIVPRSRDDLETLLDFYLLDKCVYELGYELNNRPEWVSIPLRGLVDLLGKQGSS